MNKKNIKPRLVDAMKCYCECVENGKIRKTTIYNYFKKLIEEAETPRQIDKATAKNIAYNIISQAERTTQSWLADEYGADCKMCVIPMDVLQKLLVEIEELEDEVSGGMNRCD